jgi:aryl-alcohol dehydrogenase-like predicted oxidoreductase
MQRMTSSTPSTIPATPTTPMSPASPARPVRLGPHDVFPLGLGCMGMSDMYGASDEAESVATIQAAIDRGVNLLDTGDFYGRGANELLLGRALRGRRDQVLLSVKFGIMRGPDGSFLGQDGRPSAVKNSLAHTLTRLGTDHVDIYRPARLDPSVPIEDTIGAIADLVKAGYVRAIGLSEVGPETIRRAQAVHPIADLQIEYSLASRGPEAKIFPLLAELGIGVTAYGVLSRGLLTRSKPASPADFRASLPRFTADNERLVTTLEQLAAERGVRPAQLAIAWVRAKAGAGAGTPAIVPLVGSRTRRQLDEALGALAISLTAAEVARIEAALPPAVGSRYQDYLMQHLDSER